MRGDSEPRIGLERCRNGLLRQPGRHGGDAQERPSGGSWHEAHGRVPRPSIHRREVLDFARFRSISGPRGSETAWKPSEKGLEDVSEAAGTAHRAPEAVAEVGGLY